MTTMVKVAEISSTFKSFSSKTIEKLSERNQRVVCDRIESCNVSAKIRKICQIGEEILSIEQKSWSQSGEGKSWL